ncbi:MAG: peroxiredoxin-like family protein [Pseudolabrys sp.]
MVAGLAEDKLKDLNSSPRSTTEALIRAESQNILLSSRLSAYRKESGYRRPEFAKAYDELVERLNMIDQGRVGPGLGELMPEFNLPDENGQLISLASLLRFGPVVISINRGHWCPYCKLELRSLAAIHGEIAQLGAGVISIMPDGAQFTGNYVAQNDLPFPVLSDIDLGYSLLLGLIFWVGPELQRLYKESGVELEKYHGNQGYFLPMAAKFIVGCDGRVEARQVNIEFRERVEPQALIATLRRLRIG